MLSLQKSFNSQTFMFSFSCVIADPWRYSNIENSYKHLDMSVLWWDEVEMLVAQMARVQCFLKMVAACLSVLSLSVYVNTTSHLSPCQLLDEPQFRCITKIKTIGSTYMAASGVTPDVSNGYNSIKVSMVTWLLQLQCVSWLTEPTSALIGT